MYALRCVGHPGIVLWDALRGFLVPPETPDYARTRPASAGIPHFKFRALAGIRECAKNEKELQERQAEYDAVSDNNPLKQRPHQHCDNQAAATMMHTGKHHL